MIADGVMKFCPRCGDDKPAPEFHKDRRSRDGLQVYCKACKVLQASARRERIASDPARVVPDSKACVECRQFLPRGDFYPSRGELDGLSYRCRACTSVAMASLKYGLSFDEVAALRAKGKCDICGRRLGAAGKGRDAVNIDHCHSTGTVRGVLCCGCNHMLGNAKDSPEVLEKGAAYLRASLRCNNLPLPVPLIP